MFPEKQAIHNKTKTKAATGHENFQWMEDKGHLKNIF